MSGTFGGLNPVVRSAANSAGMPTVAQQKVGRHFLEFFDRSLRSAMSRCRVTLVTGEDSLDS